MKQSVLAIDAWMQHPTRKFLTHSMFTSLNRWNRSDTSAMESESYPAYDPNFTVASMDAGQVEAGLICAWYGPEGPLITNEDVRKVCVSHPERFYGVASADIRDPLKAVQEVRHYVEDHGFVGVRVLPWLWEKYATDRLFYPIYTECARLNVPICLQVGHTGPMRMSDVGRPMPYLERVALDFPTLKIVGGHTGAPWTEEMIFLTTKFENVYIDMSAYKPSRYPKELVEYMQTRGRKKVLYGSNYPMITHADISQQIDQLGLDEEAKMLFLRGNAERVFGLNAKKSGKANL